MMRLFCLIALIQLVPAGQAFAQHDAALIERGQKVFTREKCSTCHAIAGKGNQKGPLDDVGAKFSGDEIRRWIVSAPEMAKKTNASRKPPMKAYVNIPTEDLEALVAYLQSL